MIDNKEKKVIKKKSKTINKIYSSISKGKNNKKYRKKAKKDYIKGGGKIINVKKYIVKNRTKTKIIKNSKKFKSFNIKKNTKKLTKKLTKQYGGTTTNNVNIEPTVPLRESLRFGEQLDQNVNNLDLGSKWPGKPPYPPDCCIM